MKRIWSLIFLLSFGSNVQSALAARFDDSESLAEAAGAPLFEGMGSFHMGITTDNQDAQRYFDQGMVLAFGFNHAESIRSFKAAQTLDPNCAMCFWGEALATGPNINVTRDGKATMTDSERTNARRAIKKALDLMINVTEKEQDWILALDQRYTGDVDTPRDPLDRAWISALEKMSIKYPADTTLGSILAESLMITMPWDYWGPMNEAKPTTIKVIEKLEEVMEIEPDHPLALHLYIHTLEASASAKKAESAADRLANLVPGSGHLVHMPSHIYFRIGRYRDALNANVKAAEVDEEYIKQCNVQGFYPAAYYPHNIHFLWASATMLGQSELSMSTARRLVKNLPIEQIKVFPTIQFFHTVPMVTMVRFARWQEIFLEPEPYEEFVFAKAIWHYGRGVAYAATGRPEEAVFELDAIVSLEKNVGRIFMGNAYPARDLLEIAKVLLRGELAYRNKAPRDAVAHFRKAVALQDALPYAEPPFWYYPSRQALGAALLADDRPVEAQAIFEEDLQDFPLNGWSMLGLSKALEAQDDLNGAAAAKIKFEKIWQFADIELVY